jgi:hypothetical protein
MKVVHTKFLTLKYKASIISPANIIFLLSWALNVYLSLYIVYRSDGMWVKSVSVFAKPDVNFQHDIIVVLDKSHPSPGKIVYSTFAHLNKFISTSSYRIPRISNYEIDDDEDGLLDRLNLETQVHLQPNEEVTGVLVVLFFDWRLRGNDRNSKNKFRMESTAVIDYKSNSPGSGLSVLGDLKFQQKDLLKEDFIHLESDMRSSFDNSLENLASLSSFSHVLREFTDKSNFSTVLCQSSKYSWTNGRDVSFDGFKIKATINYPSQEMLYRPGFWYNIKWAFIQLCPIFFVIFIAMEWMRRVIFEQHMIPTIQSME